MHRIKTLHIHNIYTPAEEWPTWSCKKTSYHSTSNRPKTISDTTCESPKKNHSAAEHCQRSIRHYSILHPKNVRPRGGKKFQKPVRRAQSNNIYLDSDTTNWPKILGVDDLSRSSARRLDSFGRPRSGSRPLTWHRFPMSLKIISFSSRLRRTEPRFSFAPVDFIFQSTKLAPPRLCSSVYLPSRHPTTQHIAYRVSVRSSRCGLSADSRRNRFIAVSWIRESSFSRPNHTGAVTFIPQHRQTPPTKNRLSRKLEWRLMTFPCIRFSGPRPPSSS